MRYFGAMRATQVIDMVVVNVRVVVDSCERSAVQPHVGFGVACLIALVQ